MYRADCGCDTLTIGWPYFIHSNNPGSKYFTNIPTSSLRPLDKSIRKYDILPWKTPNSYSFVSSTMVSCDTCSPIAPALAPKQKFDDMSGAPAVHGGQYG